LGAFQASKHLSENQIRLAHPFSNYLPGKENGLQYQPAGLRSHRKRDSGTIRWLRPDFQDPARRAAREAAAAAAAAEATANPSEPPTDGREAPALLPNPEHKATFSCWVQADFGINSAPEAVSPAPGSEPDAGEAASGAPAPAKTAQPWPSTLPEQVRAVAQLLAASPAALPLPAIEAGFKGKGPWKKSLPRILETLEALGRAQREGDGWRG
jgi:hypothetical protein